MLDLHFHRLEFYHVSALQFHTVLHLLHACVHAGGGGNVSVECNGEVVLILCISTPYMPANSRISQEAHVYINTHQ